MFVVLTLNYHDVRQEHRTHLGKTFSYDRQGFQALRGDHLNPEAVGALYFCHHNLKNTRNTENPTYPQHKAFNTTT